MDWVLWSCGGEDALSSGTVNSWMVSVWACEREGVPLPGHPQVAQRVFQKVFSFKDPLFIEPDLREIDLNDKAVESFDRI